MTEEKKDNEIDKLRARLDRLRKHTKERYKDLYHEFWELMNTKNKLYQGRLH